MNPDDPAIPARPNWGGLARSFLGEDDSSTDAMQYGDYLLEEEIGRGGMGIIYRARQLSLDRTVALKVMREGAFAGGQEIERFRQEASAAAALRHPGIIPVFDTGECKGRFFYAMEWIAGQNLAERTRESPVPPREAAQWVRQVAEAIQHAHSQGVVHRDLKPANVMLDGEGRARVTDFGMAQRADTASGLTLSGQMLGTPGYMAPEMAIGNARTAGAAADIYGLGALLFHLVTGRAPFVGESHSAILQQLADSDPVAPRLLNPSVPRDLETVCLKALHREPSRRYASAQDMADDLSRFLEGRPVFARPVSGIERAWRWCRRKPALAAATLGIFLLGAGIVVTTLLSNRRIDALRRDAVARLYASDMRLALQNIGEGKYGAAITLLERHQPTAGGEDSRGFEWYLARQLCRSEETAALEPATGVVRALAWSPDGRWIAAGADNFQLWEMSEGRPLLRHQAAVSVRALAFSADSRRLAVSRQGGTTFICAPAAPQTTLATLQGLTDVAALAWAGTDTLEILASNRQLRWTAGSGDPKPVAELPGEPRGPVVSSTGKVAAFVLPGQAGTVTWRLAIWNPRGASLLAESPIPNERLLRSLACSEDGRWLATGDYTGRFTLRESPFSNVAWDEVAHRGWVDVMAFSRDATLLASAGDQIVRLWHRESRNLSKTFRGHRQMISAMTFSPDGQWLVSGDRSGAMKLWATAYAPDLSAPTAVNGVAASSDAATLCWSPSDNQLRCASPGGGAWTFTVDPLWKYPVPFLGGVAVRQRGDASGTRLRLHFRDRPAEFTEWDLPGPLYACSADGNWFYYTDAGSGLPMLADRSGQNPPLPLGMEKNPAVCSFSADSRLCAMGYRDGWVRVFDIAARREILAILAHHGWVYGKGFSRDGSVLATAGFDGFVRLWKVATGQPQGEFSSNAETFWSVAISPDGRRIAAGTGESTVVFWDSTSRLETGAVDLGIPRVPVESVNFTPDGAALFAQSRLLSAPR